MNNKIKAVMLSGVSFLSIFALAGIASADTITSQLGLGSRGPQVTTLQNFLASNPVIYSQGLVTGYFGSLTKAAVEQFQANYNIAQVGHVGPITMAAINNVIASGFGIDLSAPVIMNVSVLPVTNSSAMVNFITDTSAIGKVYYSNAPLGMSEPETPFTAPGISGIVAQTDGSLRTSQSITLSGLQSNTTYYYVVESIDASGNVSVSQQNTFHTSL